VRWQNKQDNNNRDDEMAELQELNTHAEAPEEEQEYIDKMVAKAEGGPEEDSPVSEDQEEPTEAVEAAEPAAEEKADERPDWLPEKFSDAEELAKAYSNLEKKLGKKKEEAPPAPKDPVEALNFESYSTEFSESGELSEDSYTQLADAGIPKDVVDAYIEGRTAVTSNVQQSVYSEVGGEAQYQEMMVWASDNLTPSEVQMYDSSVNSNDMDQTMYAVKGLHARYAAEHGVEPTLVQAENSPMTTGIYQSAAEVKKDMSDPRYSSDPAFRRKVEQRLARSDVF
jgi:hypothetical protein